MAASFVCLHSILGSFLPDVFDLFFTWFHVPAFILHSFQPSIERILKLWQSRLLDVTIAEVWRIAEAFRYLLSYLGEFESRALDGLHFRFALGYFRAVWGRLLRDATVYTSFESLSSVLYAGQLYFPKQQDLQLLYEQCGSFQQLLGSRFDSEALRQKDFSNHFKALLIERGHVLRTHSYLDLLMAELKLRDSRIADATSSARLVEGLVRLLHGQALDWSNWVPLVWDLLEMGFVQSTDHRWNNSPSYLWVRALYQVDPSLLDLKWVYQTQQNSFIATIEDWITDYRESLSKEPVSDDTEQHGIAHANANTQPHTWIMGYVSVLHTLSTNHHREHWAFHLGQVLRDAPSRHLSDFFTAIDLLLWFQGPRNNPKDDGDAFHILLANLMDHILIKHPANTGHTSTPEPVETLLASGLYRAADLWLTEFPHRHSLHVLQAILERSLSDPLAVSVLLQHLGNEASQECSPSLDATTVLMPSSKHLVSTTVLQFFTSRSITISTAGIYNVVIPRSIQPMCMEHATLLLQSIAFLVCAIPIGSPEYASKTVEPLLPEWEAASPSELSAGTQLGILQTAWDKLNRQYGASCRVKLTLSN